MVPGAAASVASGAAASVASGAAASVTSGAAASVTPVDAPPAQVVPPAPVDAPPAQVTVFPYSVGTNIARAFGDEVYAGRVVALYPDDPELCRVRYTDGDEEDMDFEETQYASELYEQEFSLPSPTANKNANNI